jgi:two-component system nitrogen regulation sensor histidine kinase GlnL
MAPLGRTQKRVPEGGAVEPYSILAALPAPVVVIDQSGDIDYANAAAEQFFETSAANLTQCALGDFLPHDSPVFALVESVRHSGHSVSEYGVTLETPKLGTRVVTIQAAPLAEDRRRVVISLHERSIADKIDRQLTHRNAARSVTAMAAMLAHEVKNPLSGIRLICDETDRICALVDRMDVFSDRRPFEREPVNIHEVLERVRKLAVSGFARHVRFIEEYDPSLPPVDGNRDLLIQVFLNLVKNAAEAVPEQGGEIQISTAYRHGVRLAVAGSDHRIHLPLVVTVTDNGEGIPDDLQRHLFDPFVTTKRNGSGLGLALVAKVVGDHGGVVEFESQPRHTMFRVFLPMAPHAGGGR